MMHLRHALRLFLLLTVLALAVPLPTSQDNTKQDDTSSQSDRSDDQQSDQVALNDFIFEHPSILHNKLPCEICFEAVSPASENHFPIQVSRESFFLPHVFISE